VHPIEQLRYVARTSGADASLLVQEAASALAFFADDRAGLLTAARRLLTRQPTIGPLWSLGARMAMADEPRAEARQVIRDHRSDPTADVVVAAVPDGARVLIVGWPDVTVQALLRRGDVSVLVVDVEGQARSVIHRFDRSDIEAEAIDPGRMAGAVEAADLVLLEAGALGPAAAMVDVGGMTAAAVARAVHTPTWLVAGVGRSLPEPYWQALVERGTDPRLPAWLAPHEVIGLGLVDRVATPSGLLLPGELGADTCPFAAELLRPVK
jgi:hypothetical protein